MSLLQPWLRNPRNAISLATISRRSAGTSASPAAPTVTREGKEAATEEIVPVPNREVVTADVASGAPSQLFPLNPYTGI
jgi:hypothetical protein